MQNYFCQDLFLSDWPRKNFTDAEIITYAVPIPLDLQRQSLFVSVCWMNKYWYQFKKVSSTKQQIKFGYKMPYHDFSDLSQDYTFSFHPWTDAGQSPILLPFLPFLKSSMVTKHTIIAYPGIYQRSLTDRPMSLT